MIEENKKLLSIEGILKNVKPMPSAKGEWLSIRVDDMLLSIWDAGLIKQFKGIPTGTKVGVQYIKNNNFNNAQAVLILEAAKQTTQSDPRFELEVKKNVEIRRMNLVRTIAETWNEPIKTEEQVKEVVKLAKAAEPYIITGE